MLNDLLNLCSVPRWCVSRMTQPQSVAEHSFRTAVIAWHLCKELRLGEFLYTPYSVMWALVHDMPEFLTSDCPSPIKDEVGRELFNAAEHRMGGDWYNQQLHETPAQARAVVKVADVVEGFTWWRLVGDRRQQHPWIKAHGPIAHNLASVHKVCIDKADIACIPVNRLIHAVLTTCETILGPREGDLFAQLHTETGIEVSRVYHS